MTSRRSTESNPACARIVVRGIGAFTSGGAGADGVGAASRDAEDRGGAAMECLRILEAETGPAEELIPKGKIARLLSRAVRWSVAAGLSAVRDARTDEFPCDPRRLGVFTNGFDNIEELAHAHTVLRRAREQDLDWERSFGAVANGLPSMMLIRRLPNAASHHISTMLQAKGYNATLFTGAVSGLDGVRFASAAIRRGRLDAAVVAVYDSPLRWEKLPVIARLTAEGRNGSPFVVGEGGVALYLEREDLHPGRPDPGYARVVSGAAGQARDGVCQVDRRTNVRPRHLAATARRIVDSAMAGLDASAIRYRDLSDVGIDWWDGAESEAVAHLDAAPLDSSTTRTGYLFAASGGCGVAKMCYRLSKARKDTLGLVLRAAPTGQCSAVVLAAAGEREEETPL